jgi:hypothetical protein
MQRHDVKDVKGKTLIVLDQRPKQRHRKLSKAEIRVQAAAAFLARRAGQGAKYK